MRILGVFFPRVSESITQPLHNVPFYWNRGCTHGEIEGLMSGVLQSRHFLQCADQAQADTDFPTPSERPWRQQSRGLHRTNPRDARQQAEAPRKHPERERACAESPPEERVGDLSVLMMSSEGSGVVCSDLKETCSEEPRSCRMKEGSAGAQSIAWQQENCTQL